jgi:hypothetical protein
MLGAFVIPASRLDDLAALLVGTMTRSEEPWNITVILDGDLAAAAATAASFETTLAPAVRIVGAEVGRPVPVPANGRVPSGVDEHSRLRATAPTSISATVVPYLEIASSTATPESVDDDTSNISRVRSTIRRTLGAALRCGGATSDLVPDPGVVAAFLIGCRDRDLPFRITGDLHVPIRRMDEAPGLAAHGLLNLLVAATLAEQGADHATVTSIVSEEDGEALKVGAAGVGWRELHAGADLIKKVRSGRFISHADGSFARSVVDLERLGVLAPSLD